MPSGTMPGTATPAVDVAAELAAAESARVSGDLDEVRHHLQRAVEADPSLYEPRLLLVELLLDAGSEHALAGTLLREAESMRANDPRLGRLLGAWLEERGDDAGAADAYGRALTLTFDVDLALRRGLVLRRLGRAQEATKQLEAVRAVRPDRLTRENLAQLYEATGRAGDAEAELVELTRAAPTSPAPLHRLAEFYRRHGEPKRAARVEAEARKLERAPRVLRPLRSSSR